MTSAVASRQEKIAFGLTPCRGVTLLRARFITHRYERHAHDTFCIGVTDEGVQAFRCRGEEHTSLRGNVMALNPEEPHDGHAGVPRGYAYQMLYLAPSVIQEWLAGESGATLRLGYFSRPVIADDRFARQLREAIAALRQPSETLRGQTLVINAIVTLFQRWAAPRPVHRSVAIPRWINLVRDYLEERYAEDITVEKLSEIACVSRVHVTRAFERAYGLPPHRYLNAVRIRVAKRLLEQGIPTAAVAFDVGYADQSHFTKRFKGSVGVPPTMWRRAVCGG